MQKIRSIVSLQDVLNAPAPQATNTYKPVLHKELIEMTLNGAVDNGLALKNTQYMAGENAKIVTAYYDFTYGMDGDMGLRIAWQNSYNKKVSLKFAIGAHVYVCENGCFSGDIAAFRKKHVGQVQVLTPETIREYFQRAGEMYSGLVGVKEKMKTVELDKKAAASLIGDMYINEGLIKETQIAIIKKEMENPSFDYGAKDTAWELYNNVTFALKTVHPTDYIDSHVAVNDYFVKAFN